jgi:Family of unknown function (DUF5701)
MAVNRRNFSSGSLRCARVPAALATLPNLPDQAERLIELGVHRIAGLPADRVRAAAHHPVSAAALLVVHHSVAPASALTPLLRRAGKPGFVVNDMSDVDDFTPIASVDVPDAPLYLLCDLDRGDAMSNWSPEEALPAIIDAGRTPLTLTEAVHWLLQRPDVLERGRCFMTIGSRLRKPSGALDARTPAVWISNGTGRDGSANRNAPKVGWCWAGNRHTWLGFASAGARFIVER